MTMPGVQVARLVAEERDRQNQLVRDGTISLNLSNPMTEEGLALSVLMEEVGEVAKAINEDEHLVDLRKEYIQVAAVASARAEGLTVLIELLD